MIEHTTLTPPILSAYYFPNYHADARNEQRYGAGWTEWELVKRAVPRFAGHDLPLVPKEGYLDEADPAVMQRKIEAATSHGIGHFIFDWYYYDDGPFLQRALDEGFLGAPNPQGMKFSLMWANHDWMDIFPAKPGVSPALLSPGEVNPGTLDRIVAHICERYLSHPRYFRLNGLPYFSIYALDTFSRTFGGGRDGARRGLERIRERVAAEGLDGIHLNCIAWDIGLLQGEEKKVNNPFLRAEQLGFDSATSYVWVHHVDVRDYDLCDYQVMEDHYFQMYESARDTCRIPVFPNVTVGWDPSARTDPMQPWDPTLGYPYQHVLRNNTPEAFGDAIRRALGAVAPVAGDKIVTINAWNEWTEGSYLEPDRQNGSAYLKAVRSSLRPRAIAPSKPLLP
jgi:hypothetical protein